MADAAAKDITALDGLIAKLQVIYEQYFSGGINREPLELVRQAEDIIRTYSQGQISSPTLRFRFNNLIARYNSYKSVWERRKRRLEGATPARAYGLKHGPKEEDSFTFLVPEGPLRDDQAADIFNHYLELRRRCNEPVDKIRPENFRAILSEHILKIRKKSGYLSILVKVDIYENKSRISAKPFE